MGVHRDRRVVNGETMMDRWMDNVDDRLKSIEDKYQEIRDLSVSLKYLFWAAIVTGLVNVGTTIFELISGASGK